MMELGFNMAGTEKKFEEMLRVSDSAVPDHSFTYLEVGVAEGSTIIAVRKWCEDNIPGQLMCVGLDLVSCPFIDLGKFIYQCPGRFSVYSEWYYPQFPLSLFLMESPDSFWTNYKIPTNFCLIDGCHGRACVMKDFHSIAPWIKPGGIVAFHDAMPEDQGKDWQPHCREEINVRTAIQNLGLLDNVRDGWETAGEVHGDKSRQGNGFAFFRKVEPPSSPS